MAAFRTLKRWLAPAVVSGVAVAVAACGRTPGGPTAGPAAPPAPADVGGPLYAADKMPPAPPPAAGAEPIVLPQAIIQFDEKITLAAQVDGEIEMIAKPLDRTAKYDPADPKYGGRLIPRPRETTWMHVRLMDGDPIRAGEVLAFLDDSQVAVQLKGLEKSLDTAKRAAREGDDSVKQTQEAVNLIKGVSSTGKMELIQYEVQLARTKVDQARTAVDLVRYESEYAVTKDKWQRHYIYSPVTGRVVRIVQFPGQFVKAGEPILEVQNTSRFRVEAKVDRQEADRVKQYTPVSVEPVRSVGPEPYTARHRQEVTGVAVTAHPGHPLVVSASNDGTALVWDVTGDKKQHVLPHPSGTGVRCVAATARAKDAPHLIATGGSDGRIRLWDLSNPAQLPDKPAAEFEDAHAQAATAAAFSPDGRFLATAAGRDVFVWDVPARKKKYALPPEHKDDVKALRFTPQGTLVTVCRDKAVRVWQVGSDGAAVARTLDHRSGAVDVLGVSTDGGRALFDQEPSRVDVVTLADGRTAGSLLNAGGGTRFSTFALFSADDQFVLTGAGDAEAKGEMQLWAAIGGGRGSERRRLVTQGRAAVTCAAFSPDPANKFVAVGTQTGTVHFWRLPDPAEQSALKGRVVSVLPNDARTAQVRVEVENPDGKLTDLLQDRGAATVIIDPTAKPEPPALPTQPAEPPLLRPVPGGAGLNLPPLPGGVSPAAGTGSNK